MIYLVDWLSISLGVSKVGVSLNKITLFTRNSKNPMHNSTRVARICWESLLSPSLLLDDNDLNISEDVLRETKEKVYGSPATRRFLYTCRRSRGIGSLRIVAEMSDRSWARASASIEIRLAKISGRNLSRAYISFMLERGSRNRP